MVWAKYSPVVLTCRYSAIEHEIKNGARKYVTKMVYLDQQFQVYDDYCGQWPSNQNRRLVFMAYNASEKSRERNAIEDTEKVIPIKTQQNYVSSECFFLL